MDKDLAATEAKRLIAMEKRQEDDAYLLSREYDDDYDDQACWRWLCVSNPCADGVVVVVLCVLAFSLVFSDDMCRWGETTRLLQGCCLGVLVDASPSCGYGLPSPVVVVDY